MKILLLPKMITVSIKWIIFDFNLIKIYNELRENRDKKGK